MKFPNAAEGVKKLFTAGILELVAAACTGILLLATLLVYQSGTNIQTTGITTDANVAGFLGGAAVMVVFALGALVLFIIALVFKIKGVNRAKTDEEGSNNFSMAFIFIILSLVLGIASGCLTSVSKGVSDGLKTFSEVCNYLGSWSILTGVAVLAEGVADTELAKKAKSTANILCIAWLLTIITEIVARFVSSTLGAALTIVVAVAGLVFSILASVLYLVVLNKAKASFAEK